MDDRPYQHKAREAVNRRWRRGAKAVCLVSPTGSGKTVMAVMLVRPKWRVLWVVHTRELVDQAAAQLRTVFGADSVGIVMPGREPNPAARIQVYSTATALVHQAIEGVFDLLIFDEAHHYAAPVWRGLTEIVEHERILGLTATPERRDGRPLGDVLDSLVEAVSQGDLLGGKWVVPSRILRPLKPLGHDLAQHPADAVRRYCADVRSLVYVPRIDDARAVAAQLRAAGVPAYAIEAGTEKRERDRIINEFRQGKVRSIVNVRTMVEGVDVPEVEAVVLAQPFTFVGGYLQAVGRGRRASPGKKRCTIIDLTGATHQHGSPDEERVFSLKGRPITRREGEGAGPSGGNDREAPEVHDADLFDAETGKVVRAAPLPPIKKSAYEKAALEYMERQMRGAKAPRVRDLIRKLHEQQRGDSP